MEIIECIPNFSEGQNPHTIAAIKEAIVGVEGIALLGVEPGYHANRTVFTFAGEAEAVCTAALAATKVAAHLIDMSQHTGEHPRLGATDVMPLVPISGISLEKCAMYAQQLAQKIATELGIPTYTYEAAQQKECRKRLETIRQGEYESLEQKLANPQWQPDFGCAQYTNTVKKSGATIVGARDFLVAVNFSLTPTNSGHEADTKTAKIIARNIRQSGYKTKDGVHHPGLLKGCKAIGWWIEEYGCAQVSMNITDINATALHTAYTAVRNEAEKLGTTIKGTEIIGLVPQKVITEAGKFFAPHLQNQDEIIAEAITAMNLNVVHPFDPNEKIIELKLNNNNQKIN